jgi:hypothetical protein
MAAGGNLPPAIPKLVPDGYMMNFYPMHHQPGDYDSSTLRYMKMNKVVDPSREKEFETRVKEWLKLYITNILPGETIVLAVAPGHLADDKSSFMYKFIGEFISENFLQLHIEDGRSLLVRYKTIEKQSSAGASRSESTHRDSIGISPTSPLINQLQGKVVVILDDVWTSGCTLRVCEEKVRTNTVPIPKDVRLLAIGKLKQSNKLNVKLSDTQKQKNKQK